MLKKKLALVLAMAMAASLALSGCGNPHASDAGSSSGSGSGGTSTAAPSGGSGESAVLATGGSTGTYYGVGSGMCTVLNPIIGDVLNMTATSTGASKENVQGITDGKYQLAILQSDVLTYAHNGEDMFEEPETDALWVAGLYNETVQITARGGITDVSELAGKTVCVGVALFTIMKRRELNPTVTEFWVHAPLIAKKAKAGQFVIVRAKEDSERIPLTIAGFDPEAGTVSIIFQVVGAGTMELNTLREGDAVHDFVGPLGKATEIEGLKNACVVGGGVGCAIALPVAQALHAQGTRVTGIVGFRSKDLVILEDEFRACCDDFIIVTDDGSYGQKGVVTAPLEEKIQAGANFDEVIAIGPLVMMKFVVRTTKPHNIKTVVSMNPIMVDGTGMCGGCRLTVGGKTRFACVDGPDFDGFEVDFDEAMHRGTMYKPFEAHARDAECNLLKQEVQ